MTLQLNECIAETKQALRKNHKRAMLVYNYLLKDIGHKSYNIGTDYYNGIVYKSWDHNTTGSGAQKENDIVFLIREMYDKGLIKWYSHEPNGQMTYPDLRIWFNDSENCNILYSERSIEHFEKQEERDGDGHYIYLGDDYVNFEIKSFKVELAKRSGKKIYVDKSNNLWTMKIGNGCISDVNELMSNKKEMMLHMNTYNLMIGYTYIDYLTENNKWIKSGILKTIGVDMMPLLYNVDFHKKCGREKNVFMHNFSQEEINNDVYNGHYDLIDGYYEKFFAAFAPPKDVKV